MKQTSRGRISGCPSQACEAGDPKFLSYSQTQVPKEVLEQLNALHIAPHNLKRCAYCGVVWARVIGETSSFDKILGVKGERGQTRWLI